MRKADATGRSIGASRPAGAARKWKIGEAFIHFPLSLLLSPGWKCLSSPARRFVDFLALEHLTHGGRENGRLYAPHAQLDGAGISSRDTKDAIDMAVAFGLVRITTQGARLNGRGGASRYALTWLPTADGAPPTYDYKRITQAEVASLLSEFKAKRDLKKARKLGNAVEI